MPAIDIGYPAINRPSGTSPNITLIATGNPANASGVLTRIQVYCDGPITGLEVATFFIVAGLNFSTRDTVLIGNVPAGLSSHTVALAVEAGDYIGFVFAAGAAGAGPNWNTLGGDGYWWRNGDNIPCVNVAFALLANRIISIWGDGLSLPIMQTDPATGVT